ncbi:RcnB family protein [Sphingomonas qilianensis]
MAATALIPGAAMAQRGERDGNPGWQRSEGRAQGGREARLSRQQNEARPERVRPQQQQPQQVAAPVQAQPQLQQQARPQRADGRTWGGNGQRGDRGQNGYQRGAQAQPQAIQQNRSNGVYRGTNDRGQWGANGGIRNERRGNDNRGGQWRGNDNRGGNWNRNWRQDNRYDWTSRRQYNRNAYHLPRYYAPSGWRYGYRRFDIGFTLSALLFNRNYWIDNANYYGLPEAYGEYRWVRYYNDALLVDVYSGQVVDTVYDIFW